MPLNKVYDALLWGGSIVFAAIFGLPYQLAFDETINSKVAISSSKIIAETSPRYLSVALSPVLMQDNFKLFNISSVRANTLMKGLSPSILRVGGTAGDTLTFSPIWTDAERIAYREQGCNFDAKTRYLFKTPDIVCKHLHNVTITGKEWDKLNEFAYRNGARLLFGINALKRKEGLWNPHNALEIFNYTLGKRYTSNLYFELGNEPNSYLHKFNFTLSASQHAKDFQKLHEILKQEPYKSSFKDSLLVGPDITKPNKPRKLKYLSKFLRAGGNVVDKITWHHYYLSAKKTSTCLDNFTDPNILDSLQLELTAIKKAIKKSGSGNTKMWIGETATASGGGLEGASDRYVAGFMWLDKLGMAAKNGIDLIVRQTFYYSNYALLDTNLEPTPDYWLSWVFKQLVGQKVINVTCNDTTRKTRVYAHCANQLKYTPGGLTLYAMNLYEHSKVNLLLPTDFHKLEKHIYLLEPGGPDRLTSKRVMINGVDMKLVNDVSFPQLVPKVISPERDVTLPPRTFAFIVIPNANFKLCN